MNGQAVPLEEKAAFEGNRDQEDDEKKSTMQKKKMQMIIAQYPYWKK